MTARDMLRDLANDVDDFDEARAAALRALADRWDAEEAFLFSEVKKSGSDYAAVALCVLGRLDADLDAPLQTEPR